MPEDTEFSCPRCQFGHCRPTKATYVQLYEGFVISAPDMPAYICDVCDYSEFDSKALRHVLSLIDHTQRVTPPTAESNNIPVKIDRPAPKTKPREP